MVKRVYMKHNSDCAIAALAMYHGVSYKKAYDAVMFYKKFDNFKVRGNSIETIRLASGKLGRYLKFSHGLPNLVVENNKKAILIVAEDSWGENNAHALFFDGKRVYDTVKASKKWNRTKALKKTKYILH